MSHPHAMHLIRLEPQVRTYQPTTNFQGTDTVYIVLHRSAGQYESNPFVVTCCDISRFPAVSSLALLAELGHVQRR